MKNKLLVSAASVAILATMAVSANAQIISQPGETMGVALGAPLPEGVFFVDNENYGKRDGVPGHLGVNIPLIAWSTPFSFYDTRIEVLAAVPWTHIDGPSVGGLNRVDFYSGALLVGGAHDFGNGFNGAIFAGVRTPDNFTQVGRGPAADMRASLSYVKDGWNATLTFAYSGNFGGKVNLLTGTAFNDNIYVDYTLAKTFDKVTIGVVGFAQTDLNQIPGLPTQASVAVGGLIGYDFGKFTLQGMVTREVAIRNGGYGLGAVGVGGQYETRGWMRLILPLYVAPAAPALVRARY